MEFIMDPIFFFLSAMFISLSGVMMPGQVFAVTITKGYRNKIAGAFIAVGHGVIEFPLMFLIYFGLAEFFASSVVQKSISFAGGLILIYMGVQTFRAEKQTNEKYEESTHSSFVAGFLATIANPYFFLWWTTVGTTLIVNASFFGFIGVLLFAVTHWSCDLLWDTFVSMTVFKSKRFWTKRARNIIFGFCFIVLVGFGTWFIILALI